MNVWNKINVEKYTHAFIVMWIIILPSVFWAFLKEMRFYKSLSLTGKQIQACLHFQGTLSIEVWPDQDQNYNRVHFHHEWFFSSESNSTFIDDVYDKRSDSFTHKESNFHCERWKSIIARSYILIVYYKFNAKLQ